jgi:AraC family transcriptional regulator, regulatory protein of adaptative response / methylated-DNA-[protein]-cysteine methyltransferase
MTPALTQTEMERAFFAGDASYDGLFVIGVRTTGIFCKPSCPARKPLPQNIEYCRTVRDALFAGYRPCKRCRPMEPEGMAPEWAGALRAAVEAEPTRRWSAADLRARGLAPETVRRWFQKTYGLTFAGWCRALRLGQAFTRLREGAEIDDVVFGHGFESHSGFREAFGKLFGITPGKVSGKEVIVADLVQSPLGPMVAAAVDQGLCLLEFSDRRMLQVQLQTLSRRLKLGVVPGDHPHLRQLRAELKAYFDGRLRAFTVPLHIPGTAFQEAVWQELLKIPCGETISYETLAERAGKPAAIRAAGHANGMNRICILVPCHRVVNKDGNLCGYGGGLWRKCLLLELERTGSLPEITVASGTPSEGHP